MEDKTKRTIYCGNLSDKVTEELLYELFLQAGPLESVKIPKGRAYGFITFKHDVSVPYTVALMQGVSLFGKELRLELRTGATPDHDNPYLSRMATHTQSYSCPEKLQLHRQHSIPSSRRNNFGDNWTELDPINKRGLLKERHMNHMNYPMFDQSFSMPRPGTRHSMRVTDGFGPGFIDFPPAFNPRHMDEFNDNIARALFNSPVGISPFNTSMKLRNRDRWYH